MNFNSTRGKMLRTMALILFSLIILVMSWEGQKTDAAAVTTAIPEDSIRLRILADSDRASDQLVKRRVRDAVVAQMNGWVSKLEEPQSLEAARTIIRDHLPEIEQQIKQTLQKSGKSYGFEVELGKVPFPAKLYGGTVYPAGNYEALRVTLGSGGGKNWWCVLFPPLCFIDAGSGDALAAADGDQASSKGEKDAAAPKDGSKPEVRFFLFEIISDFFNWIASLFK